MSKITKYLLAMLVFVIGYKYSAVKVMAADYVNYFGVEMTEEEKETLTNLGFNETEIYYMTEETFEENKDLDATLVATTVKYYKTETPMYGRSVTTEITEEEYNSVSDVMRGVVDTTYKRMTSTISQNGSKYRYKVTVTWKLMPTMRSYDIIGIGFNNAVYISSSVYFNFTYQDSSGTYHTSTQYYDRKSTASGGSAAYKLPTSMVGLTANLYYDVSKNTSSTLTSLTMCGDYAHATSSVPLANISNYSIGIGGISLGTNISAYYDAIPCALTTIGVSW